MVYNDLNDPTGYRREKKRRTEYYWKYVHGWKLIPCGACNGSGHYDNHRAPKCGNCDGTGKERVSPAEYLRWKESDDKMKKEEQEYRERMKS